MRNAATFGNDRYLRLYDQVSMTRARSHLWWRVAVLTIIVCGGYAVFVHWLGTRVAQAIDRVGRPFVHADGRAIVAPIGSVVGLDGHIVAKVTQIAGARLGGQGADSLMLFLGVFSDSSAAAQIRRDSTLIGVLPAVTDWSQPVRIKLTHRSQSTSTHAWGRIFLDPARVVMSVYVPDTSR
jgi:hypothetical protein